MEKIKNIPNYSFDILPEIKYLSYMNSNQNWQSIAENKVKILLAISTLESLKYILEQGSVEHKFVCDTLTEINLIQS